MWLIRDSIVLPKVLTSIIFKGAKETVIAELEEEVGKAARQLSELQVLQEQTFAEISSDIEALKQLIFEAVENTLNIYREHTMIAYIQKNAKVKIEIQKAKSTVEQEIERVDSSELSDSQAIIIGLNATFNEPRLFEQTCQDYIENYFLMQASMKENDSLKCAQKMINTVEPWNSKMCIKQNRYVNMIASRSIRKAV